MVCDHELEVVAEQISSDGSSHCEREEAKNQADHAGEFHLERARARNDVARGVGTGGIVARRVG